MKKYLFWLYVNDVHCQDYTIEATSEEEAVKKLKQEVWFEQYWLREVI